MKRITCLTIVATLGLWLFAAPEVSACGQARSRARARVSVSVSQPTTKVHVYQSHRSHYGYRASHGSFAANPNGSQYWTPIRNFVGNVIDEPLTLHIHCTSSGCTSSAHQSEKAKAMKEYQPMPKGPDPNCR